MGFLTWENLRTVRGRGGWRSAPHSLKLTEARASVKNSRGSCCATANGHWIANSVANQPTPCSGAQGCQSGSGKWPRQYHWPQRSQYCCALWSHGSSTRETAWQSCSLGFTAVAFIATSKARKSPHQGRGYSACAFHYADFIHAATRNIHPAVRSRRHISHRPAARRNIRPRKFLRLGIELDDGIRLHSGLAVPNRSVRRNRDAIRS